jgi:hypothetical protein
MEDNPSLEEKKKSKLSSLIDQAQENNNTSQYTVHYSENNWETNEEINLFLDENATINQLIEESIQKFKNELFYDNIGKKKFIVRIFKKKKKIPNTEYPICNPNSNVKDFGKSHFCLVENENEEEGKVIEKEDKLDEKNNMTEKINKEKEIKNDNIDKNDNSSKNVKDTNEKNNSNNNNNVGDIENTNTKNNKPNCRPCIIF